MLHPGRKKQIEANLALMDDIFRDRMDDWLRDQRQRMKDILEGRRPDDVFASTKPVQRRDIPPCGKDAAYKE